MKLTDREITNWLKKPPFVLEVTTEREYSCAKCGEKFKSIVRTVKFCDSCRKSTAAERAKLQKQRFRRRQRAGAPKRKYRPRTGKELL